MLKPHEVVFWKVNHKTMVNAMILCQKKKINDILMIFNEKGRDISVCLSEKDYAFLKFVLGK